MKATTKGHQIKRERHVETKQENEWEEVEVMEQENEGEDKVEDEMQ